MLINFFIKGAGSMRNNEAWAFSGQIVQEID